MMLLQSLLLANALPILIWPMTSGPFTLMEKYKFELTDLPMKQSLKRKNSFLSDYLLFRRNRHLLTFTVVFYLVPVL